MTNKTLPLLQEATGIGDNDLLLIRPSGETIDQKIRFQTLRDGVLVQLNTVADLTGYDTTNLADESLAHVRGYYDAGDGGGGMFYLDKSSTDTVDSGTVLQTDSSGRWLRIWDKSRYEAPWFGLIPTTGESGHDCSPILQYLADNKNQYEFYFPSQGSSGNKYHFYSQVNLTDANAAHYIGDRYSTLVLHSSQSGDGLFKYRQDDDPNGWFGDNIYYRGLQIICTGVRQSAISMVNSGNKPQFHNFNIHGCKFLSTYYDVYWPNMEYSISPQFVNSDFSVGIYQRGTAHATSVMNIDGCRFTSAGKYGPALAIYGARDWMIRNCYFTGNEPFDSSIDIDAITVLRTKGILFDNPGPNGGIIENCVFNFVDAFGDPTGVRNFSIRYIFNGAGANKASRYYLKNTSPKRTLIVNDSTRDLVEVFIEASTDEDFNLYDDNDLMFSGAGAIDRTAAFYDGFVPSGIPFSQIRNRRYTHGIIKASGNEYVSYNSRSFTYYRYKGGTGIYKKGDLKEQDNWGSSRPYVQNNPDWGATFVYQREEVGKIRETAFKNKIPYVNDDDGKQIILICSPHLFKISSETSVGGNGYAAGLLNSIGNRARWRDGFEPVSLYFGRTVISDNSMTATILDNCKYAQFFGGVVGSAGTPSLELPSQNYDCYEWPNDPGPPKGTSIEGDVARPLDNNYIEKWVCTSAGTSRPILATGSTTASSTNIDINGSGIIEFLPGDYITVGGLGNRRVLEVNSTGDYITVDSNMGSTLTGVVITNNDPVWSTILSNIYRSGTGSPSGSVTPDGVGQMYLNTLANEWYKSYGTANTDWRQL